jgi:hypothetical protein
MSLNPFAVSQRMRRERLSLVLNGAVLLQMTGSSGAGEAGMCREVGKQLPRIPLGVAFVDVSVCRLRGRVDVPPQHMGQLMDRRSSKQSLDRHRQLVGEVNKSWNIQTDHRITRFDTAG